MDRLFEGVEVMATRGDVADQEVTSIEFGQQTRHPRALFFCPARRESDGHAFAPARRRAGAVGLLSSARWPLAVPQMVVAPGTARSAMARVACTFYATRARALMTVGVTGTNGKTSVTHLLGVDPR